MIRIAGVISALEGITRHTRTLFLGLLAYTIVQTFGCATAPEQKYMRSSDFRGLDSVTIFVSSSDFNVYYEYGQGRSAPFLAELFGLAGVLIAEGSRTDQDSGHAKEIRRNTQIARAEAVLLDEFARELRDNSKLTVVTASAVAPSSTKARSDSAIINLHIREVALRRCAVDEARLEVLIHAELLTTGGRILWQNKPMGSGLLSFIFLHPHLFFAILPSWPVPSE